MNTHGMMHHQEVNIRGIARISSIQNGRVSMQQLRHRRGKLWQSFRGLLWNQRWEEGGGGSLKYKVRMVTSLASATAAREISVFRFACTNASAGSKGCNIST